MHIEFLVEDVSGKKMLEILVPNIVDSDYTFRIHAYKGIGRIPKHMRDASDPQKRILLTNLPKLLKGYGRTFKGYGNDYEAVVVLVCDLDRRDAPSFLAELNAVLHQCNPRPRTQFCLAIEEGEAWLLGDIPAVMLAYPHADNGVLASYVNDSICGTWEKLADAVFPGGAKILSEAGWQAVGTEKYRWAENISPRMKVSDNSSPSFNSFRSIVQSL